MKGESGISVIEANTKKSRAMQMNQVFDAGLLFDGKWMNDGADELAECKQTLSPLCVCVCFPHEHYVPHGSVHTKCSLLTVML